MALNCDSDMAVGVLNLCHREDLDARLRGEGDDCEEGDEGLYEELDEEEWREAKTLLTFKWNTQFPNGINMCEIEEHGIGLQHILDIMSETIEAIVSQRRVLGDSDSDADTLPSVYSRADTV